MLEISGIGIVAAFMAGMISFLSPCVLPLIPGYVSYIAGGQAAECQTSMYPRQKIANIALSLCFILGFSSVFISLGASASAFGQMMISYKYELNLVGGAIVILFGAFMIGLAQFSLLQRDFRVHLEIPGGKPVSAYILGLAFGFGWTPCIGPILGAILTVNATVTTMKEGVILLLIYSLGLGVPFLLAAIFTDSLSRKILRLGLLGRRLHFAAGILMIGMGIAMMTDQLSTFSYWLLSTFPILSVIG